MAEEVIETMSHGTLIGHLYSKHGQHSGNVNGKTFTQLKERHDELHADPQPYREEHNHG